MGLATCISKKEGSSHAVTPWPLFILAEANRILSLCRLPTPRHLIILLLRSSYLASCDWLSDSVNFVVTIEDVFHPLLGIPQL